MNKLIKFGLPSVLSLVLATPAMALTGYQQGSNPGPHWTNHFQGQGNWSNHSYGQNAGRNSGESSYYGQNQGSNQNYNQGQNQGSNQSYNQGQNQNYGQNDEGNGQAVSQGFLAQLQHRLQQQGFYHQGNVDGVWGPETESALQNFQQQNNLRPTGQIDMRTLEALNMLNAGSGMQNGQQVRLQQRQQPGPELITTTITTRQAHMGYNQGYNGQQEPLSRSDCLDDRGRGAGASCPLVMPVDIRNACMRTLLKATVFTAAGALLALPAMAQGGNYGGNYNGPQQTSTPASIPARGEHQRLAPVRPDGLWPGQ